MSDRSRFATIVVPLDGSRAAEAVLPVAAAVARAEGAALRLLQVAPEPHAVTSEGKVLAYVDQEADRLRGEAEDYLRGVAAGLPGLRVECVVRFGEARDKIIAEARESGADLVAIATHGRSGLGRLLMGSVAEAVMREAPCQVLVVRRREVAVERAEPATGPAEAVGAAPRREGTGGAEPAAAAQSRCLVCARPSTTPICAACEARIRGEALERKLDDEAAGRKGAA